MKQTIYNHLVSASSWSENLRVAEVIRRVVPPEHTDKLVFASHARQCGLNAFSTEKVNFTETHLQEEIGVDLELKRFLHMKHYLHLVKL